MGEKEETRENYKLPQKIIFIVALLLLLAGVIMGFLDKAGAATATYGAAVLSLIFAFLSQFKSFSGLGIKAELLDKKIKETDDLIQQLRDIMIPMSEMLISSVARAGRWESDMPRHQKLALVRQIESELKKCGVTEFQLEKAKNDWHFYNTFDLSTPVFEKINAKLHAIEREVGKKLRHVVNQPDFSDKSPEYSILAERQREAGKEISYFRDLRQIKKQEILPDSINHGIEQSKVLVQEEKQALRAEIEEELRDLEHYIKYKEFRRELVWLGNSQ